MKRITKHHIVPKSRDKAQINKDDNIMFVSDKKHKAYHILFNNALPEEAVMILINEWFYKNKKVRAKALYKLTIELSKLASSYLN